MLNNNLVKFAIKEMFKGDHFSICTIDKCLSILNIKPDKDSYDKLHLMHCVHFKAMPDSIRKEIFTLTMKIFSNKNIFDESIIDVVFDTIGDDVIQDSKFSGSTFGRKILKLIGKAS